MKKFHRFASTLFAIDIVVQLLVLQPGTAVLTDGAAYKVAPNVTIVDLKSGKPIATPSPGALVRLTFDSAGVIQTIAGGVPKDQQTADRSAIAGFAVPAAGARFAGAVERLRGLQPQTSDGHLHRPRPGNDGFGRYGLPHRQRTALEPGRNSHGPHRPAAVSRGRRRYRPAQLSITSTRAATGKRSNSGRRVCSAKSARCNRPVSNPSGKTTWSSAGATKSGTRCCRRRTRARHRSTRPPIPTCRSLRAEAPRRFAAAQLPLRRARRERCVRRLRPD